MTESEFKSRARAYQRRTGEKYYKSLETLAKLYGFKDYGELRRKHFK